MKLLIIFTEITLMRRLINYDGILWEIAGCNGEPIFDNEDNEHIEYIKWILKSDKKNA